MSYDETNPLVRSLRAAVSSLEAVSGAMTESLGAQRLPGSGVYAFRRTTNSIPVMPGVTATDIEVPAGFFDAGGPGHGTTSFMAFNPNLCTVILRGTSAAHTTTQIAAVLEGWPLPPGLSGPFSTQYPRRMSALFYPCLGMVVPPEADWKPIWVFYGGGN